MLMALTLIFVSLTMLVPSVEIIIQNNETTLLQQKVNASELIRFHTEMVSFCDNYSDECNKQTFVDFDKDNTYSKFLVPELAASAMRQKIHCYVEGNRYFTLVDQPHDNAIDKVTYNQLFNSINQYSPSYMGIGKVIKVDKKSYIQFWNGSKMEITGQHITNKLSNEDIVMVS